jgi:hypothetical protein
MVRRTRPDDFTGTYFFRSVTDKIAAAWRSNRGGAADWGSADSYDSGA